MKLPPNIILTGFMGCGKTSTGKELAKVLDFEFCDVDQWIEEKNKKKIPKIFEENGEGYFRQQERHAIRALAAQKNSIIATGGGAWIDQENRERLLQTGWCVWLKVSIESVWQRIGSHISQRPLLAQSPNPLETMAIMLNEREPFYSLAHSRIDTDGKIPKEVALEVVGTIQKEKPFDLPPMQE